MVVQGNNKISCLCLGCICEDLLVQVVKIIDRNENLFLVSDSSGYINATCNTVAFEAGQLYVISGKIITIHGVLHLEVSRAVLQHAIDEKPFSELLPNLPCYNLSSTKRFYGVILIDHNLNILLTDIKNFEKNQNKFPFLVTNAQNAENVSEVLARIMKDSFYEYKRPPVLLQIPPVVFLVPEENALNAQNVGIINRYEFYFVSFGEDMQAACALEVWMPLLEEKQWPEIIQQSMFCHKVFKKVSDNLMEAQSIGFLDGIGTVSQLKFCVCSPEEHQREISVILVGGLKQQDYLQKIMKQIGTEQVQEFGRNVQYITHNNILGSCSKKQQEDTFYADCCNVDSITKVISEISQKHSQCNCILVQNCGVFEVEELKAFLGEDGGCEDGDECCDDQGGLCTNCSYHVNGIVTVLDATSLMQDLTSDCPLLQFQSIKDKKHLEAEHVMDDDEQHNQNSLISTASFQLHQVENATHIFLTNCCFLPNSMRSYLEAVLRHLNHTAQIITFNSAPENYKKQIKFKKIDKLENIAWENLVYDNGFQEIQESFVDGVVVSSFVYRSRKPFHPERLFQFWNRYFDVESPTENEDGDEGGASKIWKSDCYDTDLGKIIRSAGEVWLATRRDSKGLWMQSGKVVKISDLGFWFDAIPKKFWPEDQKAQQKINKDFIDGIGDRQQRIAFIGLNLNYNKIKEGLNKCLCTDSELKNIDGIQDRFPQWASVSEIFGDSNDEMHQQQSVGENSIGAERIQEISNNFVEDFSGEKIYQISNNFVEDFDGEKIYQFSKNFVGDDFGYIQEIQTKQKFVKNDEIKEIQGENSGLDNQYNGENINQGKIGKIRNFQGDDNQNYLNNVQNQEQIQDRWGEKVEFGKVNEIFEGGSQLQDVLDQISEISMVEKVLIDWHAPWSTHCVEFKQIFDQIAKNSINNNKYIFIRVDVQVSFFNKKLALEKVMEYPVSKREGSMPQIKWGEKFPAVTIHTPPSLHFEQIFCNKNLPGKIFEIIGQEYDKDIFTRSENIQIDYLKKQQLEYAQSFENKLNIIKRGVRQFKDIVKSVDQQKIVIIAWTKGDENLSLQIRKFLQNFAPQCSNNFIFIDIDVSMSQLNLAIAEKVEIQDFPSFSTTKGTKLTPGTKINSFESFQGAIFKLTGFNPNCEKVNQQIKDFNQEIFSEQKFENNSDIKAKNENQNSNKNNFSDKNFENFDQTMKNSSSQKQQQNIQNIQQTSQNTTKNNKNIENFDKNNKNTEKFDKNSKNSEKFNNNNNKNIPKIDKNNNNIEKSGQNSKKSIYDPPKGKNFKGGTKKILKGVGECVFYPKMPCLQCGCPWWKGDDWDATCARCGWDCENDGYDDDSKPLPKFQNKWKEFVEEIKGGVTPEWNTPKK